MILYFLDYPPFVSYHNLWDISEKLKKKCWFRNLGIKGSLVAADNKRKIRIERTEWNKKEAEKDIKNLDRRDKFMMEWFTKFPKIPLNKMRASIWLHEELDEARAKIFWSDLTEIPLSQFHKTYIAKIKKNSKKIRKNIHEYGIISIKFSDSDKHRRIMGWIYTLVDAKISKVH